MKKPIRTPLSDEQLADARRLTDVYKKRVKESKDKGGPVLNQTEVGERCDWKSPQSTVSQYMRGVVALNLEALVRLADALNFEPSEVSPTLAARLGSVRSGASRDPGSPPPEGEDFPGAIEKRYDLIPQYSARAAAGDGHDNPHVEIHSTLAFKKDWLKAKGLQAKNLRVIYADGNSMWPTISDRDVMLVDVSLIEPADGEVFVIESLVDGTIVKRTMATALGGWTLRSDNADKDQYPDRYYLRSESNEHHIVGRVIWRGGDL